MISPKPTPSPHTHGRPTQPICYHPNCRRWSGPLFLHPQLSAMVRAAVFASLPPHRHHCPSPSTHRQDQIKCPCPPQISPCPDPCVRGFIQFLVQSTPIPYIHPTVSDTPGTTNKYRRKSKIPNPRRNLVVSTRTPRPQPFDRPPPWTRAAEPPLKRASTNDTAVVPCPSRSVAERHHA
ncbi:extensin [Iris pallida]|uniref:Extensin n=1 Tax=Iris pallida TaxID=29817 RepID=A0AAX6EHU9_IRIPA|nr:extensin [Iris pallida]